MVQHRKRKKKSSKSSWRSMGPTEDELADQWERLNAKRRDGDIESAKNNELFFVDKAVDGIDSTAAGTYENVNGEENKNANDNGVIVRGMTKLRQKRLAIKKKPLRSELALHRGAHLPVVPSSRNCSDTQKKYKRQLPRDEKEKYVSKALKTRFAHKVCVKMNESKKRASDDDSDNANFGDGGVVAFIPDDAIFGREGDGTKLEDMPKTAAVVNKLDTRKIDPQLLSYVSDQHNRTFRNRGPSSSTATTHNNKHEQQQLRNNTNKKNGDDLGIIKIDEQIAVQKKMKRAVVVDGPGSSFNPDPHHHQDTIAMAVAKEEQKAFKDSITKMQLPSRGLLDGKGPSNRCYNLDEMLLDLQHSDEEDDDDNNDDNDDDEIYNDVNYVNNRPHERVTRAERSRKIRQKVLARQEEAQKTLKKQKRDLSELRRLKTEIQNEEDLRTKRLRRRKLAQREREEELPPKLSRFQYEPDAPAVLLTEEVSGSLRKLPGTSNACTLIRDRYKALQRRGIIEPRRKVPKPTKPSKYKKFVVPGLKGQLEEQMAVAHEASKNKNVKSLAIVT